MLIKKRPRWISEPLWRRLMLQRDRRKHLRRQAVRFLKNPKLAVAYSAYRQAVRAADWPRVREEVQSLAELATKVGDWRTMAEMVNALERVGCYAECQRLWLQVISQRPKTVPNEWRGEDLNGKAVLIDLYGTAGEGLGVSYGCATFVGNIARTASRTIVIVEPRVRDTYRRSIPGIELPASRNDVRYEQVDYVALPEMLRAVFMRADGTPDPNYHFLQADRAKVAHLREGYLQRAGARRKPLIGICWHSSHHGKDLPPLAEWRDFIRRSDAIFVSLQYGNVADDLAVMGADRIMVDDTIDQLKNMDDFAAQVAALDGVITIVNTLANVGGALGVPTIVLRDDWFRRNLPVLGDRTPWYASLRVAGKDGRDWRTVLDEALAKLRVLIAEQSVNR